MQEFDKFFFQIVKLEWGQRDKDLEAKFFSDFPNAVLSSNCSLKSIISHSPRSRRVT